MKFLNLVQSGDPSVISDSDHLRRMWRVLMQAPPLNQPALDYFFDKAIERYRLDHATAPMGGEQYDNRRAAR